MQAILKQIAWEKLNGLIPVIAQDYKTQEVLMLAFMNKEALELSLQSGFAHYFSRSKQRIWKKGEQSGHTQKIYEILLDCDKDSLLVKVEQKGVACHSGAKSCFFNLVSQGEITNTALESQADMSVIYGVVDSLYHILQERKGADSKTSYTASLYHKGENTIAKKSWRKLQNLVLQSKIKILKKLFMKQQIYSITHLLGLALAIFHPIW